MIIRMKRRKKQMKMQKTQSLAFMAFSLLLLTACMPLTSVRPAQEPIRQPIEVLKMTASAAQPPSIPALYCRVGRGEALFGRQWHDFQDASFSLHQGERLDIAVGRKRGTEAMAIHVFFDSGGQRLVFCPRLAGSPKQPVACASLYALEEDLQTGIKRTLDIPKTVRGAEISCAYSIAGLKPLEEPRF